MREEFIEVKRGERAVVCVQNVVLEELCANVARLRHQQHAQCVASRYMVKKETSSYLSIQKVFADKKFEMISPERWLLATWRPISTTIVSLRSDLTFVNSAVQHSLMHPGWKNFQTFTSLKNSNQTHRSLKRHALLHGGVRPFSCATCNKGFYQRVG